jgi:hypothetical protein
MFSLELLLRNRFFLFVIAAATIHGLARNWLPSISTFQFFILFFLRYSYLVFIVSAAPHSVVISRTLFAVGLWYFSDAYPQGKLVRPTDGSK